MRYIVLLHGLGSNKILMLPMYHYLLETHSNFKILNYQFNSIFKNINENIQGLLAKMKQYVKHASQIIFIGHSLGGLIAKQLAEFYHSVCDVHCITLGTPYKGAFLANFFRQHINVLDKISPMLNNLSRKGNYIHEKTNIPHHIIIGQCKLDVKNPISWITNLILLPFDHHDGVVELLPHDFDHVNVKTLYFVNCDHVNMIFNKQVNLILTNIIHKIVDLSIKQNIY